MRVIATAVRPPGPLIPTLMPVLSKAPGLEALRQGSKSTPVSSLGSGHRRHMQRCAHQNAARQVQPRRRPSSASDDVLWRPSTAFAPIGKLLVYECSAQSMGSPRPLRCNLTQKQRLKQPINHLQQSTGRHIAGRLLSEMARQCAVRVSLKSLSAMPPPFAHTHTHTMLTSWFSNICACFEARAGRGGEGRSLPHLHTQCCLEASLHDLQEGGVGGAPSTLLASWFSNIITT